MELGVLITDCPCLAQDMSKLFHTYWTLTKMAEGGDRRALARAAKEQLPLHEIATTVNSETPLKISLGGVQTNIFLAVGFYNTMWQFVF